MDHDQGGMNMAKNIRNIFFHLEKRNHTRKHIRKLCLSGVITTHPFEILEAERSSTNQD